MARSPQAWLDDFKLYFNATPISHVADNAASSPITNTYVSFYQSDPSAGDQTTNEVTVAGMARVAVARTTGGWTVTAATVVSGVVTVPTSVSPAATITFAPLTGGSQIATHWGVGDASSGAGVLRYSGPLLIPYPMGSGITPAISTATTFQGL